MSSPPARYLGSIVGAAILVAFLGADRSDVGGLASVFVVILVAASLATLVSFGLGSRSTPQREMEGKP